MASSAISAQGTSFYISTGAGSLLTITSITKATQAVVTVGTHTVAIGDRVTFGASITGMPEIANKTAIVTAIAPTTFTVNIDSSGFATAATAGTVTPTIYVKHCELTSYSGLDGESSELDATTVCSDAKEYRTGLRDFGNFSLNHNVVLDDVAQLELQKAYGDSLQREFKTIFSNGKGFAFSGFVKSYTVDGGVDAILTGTSNVRITGSVTMLTA